MTKLTTTNTQIHGRVYFEFIESQFRKECKTSFRAFKFYGFLFAISHLSPQSQMLRIPRPEVGGFQGHFFTFTSFKPPLHPTLHLHRFGFSRSRRHTLNCWSSHTENRKQNPFPGRCEQFMETRLIRGRTQRRSRTWTSHGRRSWSFGIGETGRF